MLLAFDTCLDGCSVALKVDGRPAMVTTDRQQRGQAERLIPMIADLMRQMSGSGEAITGIALCVGPGSFTGARIGVAAARGLALVWGCPMLGLTTLEILAAPALEAGIAGRLAACLPARGGSCYMQIVGQDGEAAAPPVLLPAGDCADRIDRADTVICCPDPAALPFRPRYAAYAPAANAPAAEIMTRIAAGMPPRRWQGAPAPVYVRPPDARPSSAGRLIPADEHT